MNLKLNGQERTFQSTTIAELLAELQTPPQGVAIAQNGRVVPRTEHTTTPLQAGDEIEIVVAVQGG